MRYDFEWDPEKARRNLRRHKVSFERATTIFRDPNLLSISDDEHGESEERWITMGLDETGSFLVISHKFETLDVNARGSESFRPGELPKEKENNMKKEYDFSKGVRGKFHNPEGKFNLPIYLEPDIAEFVQKLSVEEDVDMSQIVNRLLKKDMEIIEL
jgi:uncharacterized DUF497 family protein